MNYSATNEWSKLYGPNSQISYPAEGVIRIFKGSFLLICQCPSQQKELY